MNNTAIGIISALFILIGSFFLHKLVCGGTAAPQFSIMDGNFKTNSVDAYSFGLNGAKLTAPTATTGIFKQAATYLKDNPERSLNLNGQYHGDEKYTDGSFDNLGIARAEAVRAQLIKFGAPEGSITTSGEELSSTASGKIIYNAVKFGFGDAATVEVPVIETPEEPVRSVLDPYVIRFNSGSDKITMSTELRGYLDEALAYLDSNSGTQLVVTGHTDDQGSSASNKKLSLQRASKVRRFLRNNGVKSAQVIAEGKGEAEPLEDNSTEEGRKINRRVEITIR